MKREDDFRQHLKRRGKKSHVVDTLVFHVAQFEKHLKTARKSLDKATSDDLRRFLEEAESTEPGLARKYCRGIALYYKFHDNKLHREASKYREAAVGKKRTEFRLKDFLGVNDGHVARLAEAGIKTAPQMLEAGRTRARRKALAGRTGIPEKAILELVKLSDLSRIWAVKAIRARLYYDAGIDSVEKMAGREPEELREYLDGYVKSSGFEGITPLPKELRFTVDEARKLKPVVEE